MFKPISIYRLNNYMLTNFRIIIIAFTHPIDTFWWADWAHWPSSMQNILVSSIFADELLVQLQYLKIINFLLKWSYWLRNSKISSFYKRNFVLRWIFTEIFFQIFVHEACLPKKTCVHGTLEMAPLNRASNAHEFCI